MASRVVRVAALPGRQVRRAAMLPKVTKDDRVELRVRDRAGNEVATVLPPEAAELVGSLLERLSRGEKVTLLAEDQEISPNEAVTILGMSRPLVVHRMDVGDLPFRYIGKHRRARLSDVLALKRRLDAQRQAISVLVDDTLDLAEHGL